MDEQDNRRIENADVTTTIRTSFLEYAMSVIVARALPDARDGMKPVQRRILFGMNQQGMFPDRPYKKSARITGDVMGKYHPHGDTAIYESMVRMAQDFSYRYPLVDGHGNFGSIDGDPPAAMRYTEARLSKISMEMLRDINKDTVDFVPNYDETEKEPSVLPSRIPNLLLNGATGIAVGMTTNIPPHNLSELIAGIHHLMDNPDVTVTELMEDIKGPDFPTGALVIGRSGIRQAYETGKGSIVLRAKTEVETSKTGRETIIVKEIPYMVNKARLVERIGQLVHEKKIDGITELRDESDREGMRIVIGIRSDTTSSIILNNLYKLTPLQVNFGYNMVAIVNGAPKVLNLKELLNNYLTFQETVIRRRTAFDLKKAQARIHILEGLRIALDHIDEIVSLIRSAETPAVAKEGLITKFQLDDIQAQAILDMRLVRLTGLERDKIEDEYAQLEKDIADYQDILARPERVNEIIYNELLEIESKFGDERKTEIVKEEITNFEDEDLIEQEDIIVGLTHNGYIKRLDPSDFRQQNRGGRGVQGMGLHDDDFVEQLIYTNTHEQILFFTNKGKVYSAKGYQIPSFGRNAKGLPVINLINIEKDEHVNTMVKVNAESEKEYLLFVTKMGTVKRTHTGEFVNIRNSGLRALTIHEGDELVNVMITTGASNVFIGTHLGYCVVFPETEVRSAGRVASGVRGIRLRDEDYVIGSTLIPKDSEILVISENGYGKRTPADDYTVKKRGGKGMRTLRVTEKNGPLAGVMTIVGHEDVLIVSDSGVVIRFDVNDVSKSGRSTVGVRLIRLDQDAKVATLSKAIKVEDPDEEPESEE
ncbi:DNA gyrase subunit A [Xylocopilactobacillus apicola]|uniref:DNA gyrase subunit A n=1 Tax=Xylocopilactobacillus apicola TaxID=2932184 RepID=A0AAU9CVA2_9LACO|nr:DNA gyrase subunit A [Xylocopilactobacillus apicola]